VKGFGEISIDNKRIITMEWIIEGVALIFLGLIVAIVTFTDPLSYISKTVFLLDAICLIVFAVISIFTGYRINFIPFKLCPFIFILSAFLILIGGVF
jgi:uncharacterized membrane protein YeiH